MTFAFCSPIFELFFFFVFVFCFFGIFEGFALGGIQCFLGFWVFSFRFSVFDFGFQRQRGESCELCLVSASASASLSLPLLLLLVFLGYDLFEFEPRGNKFDDASKPVRPSSHIKVALIFIYNFFRL